VSISSDTLQGRLVENGYALVHRSEDHCVYEHHGDRVVVPDHARELSPWVCRVIEWSLEPRLGRGWLRAPAATRSTMSAGSASGAARGGQLHLAIRCEPDHQWWNAFVVEEPRIVTFGATLAETRKRAADAAAAWFADVAVQVELEPLLQLDTVTEGWIDHATTPRPGDATDRLVDAARHLRLLGYTPDDVAELLTAPAPRQSNDPTLRR